MFQEVISSAKKRFIISPTIHTENPKPVRPVNGITGIKYLRQNVPIEVNNEIALWFVEELERSADFSFYYHVNKYTEGWTTICKVEQ